MNSVGTGPRGNNQVRMAETSVQALLGSIYSGHRQGLFTLALSITRNRHQAEDAVHEAFVRLCRRPHSADEPTAYVYRAVRNAAIDQTRKRARTETPEPIFTENAPDRISRGRFVLI